MFGRKDEETKFLERVLNETLDFMANDLVQLAKKLGGGISKGFELFKATLCKALLNSLSDEKKKEIIGAFKTEEAKPEPQKNQKWYQTIFKMIGIGT